MTSYEEDQRELRKTFDGDPDEIRIDPPRESPEVNPEVYRDLDPLLFRGFLHVPAKINGVDFVFKSLNHHEFSQLALRAPPGSTYKEAHRFSAYFLAYGVFMVEGVNVLPDRERHLPDLASFFEGLGEKPLNKVIRHMSEINRRSNLAVIVTEAFAMELQSRLRWAQYRGADLTSTAVTGIQGTSTLGLNWAQLTWRALNHYEDLREQAEREWENAKFVASSMAGKGMNRIHSQDRQRRDREREERIERRDRILRFALLGEPLDQSKEKGQPVSMPRTVEELSIQLERDLKGEQDWHDKVVEAYENRVREEQTRRREHLRNLQRSFDEKHGGASVVGGTDMTGLTPEEVRFRMERRRQIAAQRLSAQQVYPELYDPRLVEFENKWSQVKRDHSNVPVISPPTERPTGTPFNAYPKK